MARVWGNLAQSTRTRYERAGIGREAYESGISLTAARGHATTPERPERAEKHPERYQSYVSLRNDIRDLKRQLNGPDAKPNTKGRTRAHLEKIREILELKVNYQGSWEEFWDDHEEYDRDEYKDAEFYH